MYSEDDDGNVIIQLRRSQFIELLMALGYAAGAACKTQEADTEGNTLVTSFLRLANLINEGNPGWTPYKLD